MYLLFGSLGGTVSPIGVGGGTLDSVYANLVYSPSLPATEAPRNLLGSPHSTLGSSTSIELLVDIHIADAV